MISTHREDLIGHQDGECESEGVHAEKLYPGGARAKNILAGSGPTLYDPLSIIPNTEGHLMTLVRSSKTIHGSRT